VRVRGRTIYAELLDEGVDVWRPVEAVEEPGGVYRLPEVPAWLAACLGRENLVEGATLELICNVGPAGLATGEEEGWVLEGTPYGTFTPLSPIIGITHLSVAGERILAND
jgi:hypothetical protein